ncbi:hypothetical protein DCAR_0313499 [Daucus carota subsp. sativus]|uniref:Jacalin-type lectin domain-containing protein n=1 Tax=Daucus carota subsp. sativus TaxID=79200 RepID=A0A166C2A3_DAUCS|nr:PREDICTED: inactive protein RESTRICTED TEV MOVEMENT 1-like [Daucus carota subsp. sativus]WOG94206.1 hypothetical protein DCAR_0313499 [Daucus carota subsp. sativus]
MIRVGPTFKTYGTSWDHQGKTEIAQIFISSTPYRINSLHFVYVENGRHVLSERIGGDGSASMNTVTLDYPSEYITRVSGKYQSSNFLVSITFYTNKGTYGPFVPNNLEKPVYPPIEFNYEIGGKFYGFFGTYTSNEIESIGLYMKPIQTLSNTRRLPTI